MANVFPSVQEKGANIVRSTWDSMTMKKTKDFVTVSIWRGKKRNQNYGQYIQMRLASVIGKILRWHGSWFNYKLFWLKYNSFYLTIKRAPVEMENGSYWRTLRSANPSRKDAQLTVNTSTGIPTLPRPNNAGRYGLRDHAKKGKYYIWHKTRKNYRFTVAIN
jgi:hypothetical protein